MLLFQCLKTCISVALLSKLKDLLLYKLYFMIKFLKSAHWIQSEELDFHHEKNSTNSYLLIHRLWFYQFMPSSTCNIFIDMTDSHKILTMLALLKYVYILSCHSSVNDTSILLFSWFWAWLKELQLLIYF